MAETFTSYSAVRDFEDSKGYWPLSAYSVYAGDYLPGELLCVDPSTGLARPAADTAGLVFLGVQAMNRLTITNEAAATTKVRYDRPYRLGLKLQSGTASRLTDIGKTVCVYDKHTVQIGGGDVPIGRIVDVLASKVLDLTSAMVWVEPLPLDLNALGLPYAVAAAGSAQGDAAALREGTNIVSGSDSTKGVILPAAAPGMEVWVITTVSAQTTKVYPATGASLDAGSANAAQTIAAQKRVLYRATSKTQWYSILSA